MSVTGGSFTTWNKAPTEVSPPSSQRSWEAGGGAIPFDVRVSKRSLPGPQKDSPGS